MVMSQNYCFLKFLIRLHLSFFYYYNVSITYFCLVKCNLGPVWIPLDFRISKKLGLLRFLDSIIYGKIRNVWIHSWTLESRVIQTGPRSDQTIKAVAAFPPCNCMHDGFPR